MNKLTCSYHCECLIEGILSEPCDKVFLFLNKNQVLMLKVSMRLEFIFKPFRLKINTKSYIPIQSILLFFQIDIIFIVFLLLFEV